MKNLEKFDLQKALDGAELVTRDGREVEEWYYFKTRTNSSFPIYASIDGFMHIFTIEGKYCRYDTDSANDLFIKPKVKECWVNIYLKNDGDLFVSVERRTEAEAKADTIKSDKVTYIKTIRITDEVEENEK